MSTTPLAPFLRITDLRTDTVVATTTALIDWQLHWALSEIGTYQIELPLGDPCTLAVMQANGGVDTYQGAAPYLCEFSLDGGTTVDMRFMATTPEMTVSNSGSLILSGNDLFDLYTHTGIDRVTFHGVNLSDMLNGLQGQIPTDGTNLINQGLFLPFQQGLFQTFPGRVSWAGQSRMVFTPICDSHIASLALDMDLNADKIADALDTVMKAAGGYYDSTDIAAIGTRQYWVADSSDAALNVTGVTCGIACGFFNNRGQVLEFTNVVTDTVDETSIAPVIDPFVLDPNTDQMSAQASFIGGKSDHGLPDGGTITALQVINFNHAPTAVNWDASLLIVGISTGGNGGGGVFYYTQDGAYHPMSQAMDVNDLVYIEHLGILYAATASGVYKHSADPLDPQAWQLVGGLTLNCTKLIAPESQTTERIIFTLVSGSGSGADGIYLTPEIGTGSLQLGHDEWSQIVSSSNIIDFGGDQFLQYWADSNNAGIVQGAVPGGSVIGVPTHNGSNVIGFDYQPGLGVTFIRTAAGAEGLYYIFPRSYAMRDANADRSLVDDTGAPVLINKIVENRAGGTINGKQVALFACTDNGVYWTADPTGGNWNPCTGQSAIDDTTVNLLAVGNLQLALDRQMTRIYAAGKSSLFQSNTGGIWWRNNLNQLLDLGPFWTALAQQCGGTPYPDSDLVYIGDTTGAADEELAPTLAIPADNPRYLPPGWVWQRRLDEHNDFAYRLINFLSTDPHWGIEYAELNELQTNELMGAITAAERLALVHVRWLSDASISQTRATVQSGFWTTEAALRMLRPTDLAPLHVTETFVGMDNVSRQPVTISTNMSVLEHTIQRRQDTYDSADTTTVLSNVLHKQPLKESEIAQSLTTTLKNHARYRF